MIEFDGDLLNQQVLGPSRIAEFKQLLKLDMVYPVAHIYNYPIFYGVPSPGSGYPGGYYHEVEYAFHFFGQDCKNICLYMQGAYKPIVFDLVQ